MSEVCEKAFQVLDLRSFLPMMRLKVLYAAVTLSLTMDIPYTASTSNVSISMAKRKQKHVSKNNLGHCLRPKIIILFFKDLKLKICKT